MELRKIKELMMAMRRNGMKRLSIKEEGFELELEQESREPAVINIEGRAARYADEEYLAEEKLLRRADEAFAKGGSATTTPPVTGGAPSQPEKKGSYVKSPMVGTFYQSPSPEEPAFVKVGDTVDADTVVCIIEAMKVMNEVKSGVKGVVVELMVENNHPVEFGTPLFRVE